MSPQDGNAFDAADIVGRKPTISERLALLRHATGLSSGDLAREIGVGRTTLHVVCMGKQKPTRKFELKLEVAERKLLPRPNELAKYHSNDELIRVLTAFKQPIGEPPLAHLSYRHPGENQPLEIPLISPRTADGTALVVRGILEQDWEPLILQCMPTEYATSEFIDKLDPQGFLSVLKSCLELVMGPLWPQKLEALDKKLRSTGQDTTSGH